MAQPSSSTHANDCGARLLAGRRDHGRKGHRERNRRGSNGDLTFGSFVLA
jgi:hypothetical protein